MFIIYFFTILAFLFTAISVSAESVSKNDMNQIIEKRLNFGKELYELYEKNKKFDLESQEYRELIKRTPVITQDNIKTFKENFEEWEKNFRNENAKLKIILPYSDNFVFMAMFRKEVDEGIFDIKTPFNSGFSPLRSIASRKEKLIEEGKKENACIVEALPFAQGGTYLVAHEVEKKNNGKALVYVNFGTVKVTCESLRLEKEFSYSVYFDNLTVEDCRKITKEILQKLNNKELNAAFKEDHYFMCYSDNNPGNGFLFSILSDYAFSYQIKQWLLKELKLRGII